MLDLFGTHFFSYICLILAKRLTISPFVPLRVWHTLTKGKKWNRRQSHMRKWISITLCRTRLKFFRPFRVYDAHDMWNDFKDSGVRKAKHAWRETASGIWMLLVCSCEKNISRRNNYLLDVSHLSFTLSVRLSFLSFPFPNYPSHLFSYFPPSVYLSFLPSLSLTKFHYI